MFSSSAAMDGGLTAVADVSRAMTTPAPPMTTAYRWRHRSAACSAARARLPLRATGDADFGVPPFVLEQANLVEAIEALGYRKRREPMERPIDERRVAAVDLLVPTYRTRRATPFESESS